MIKNYLLLLVFFATGGVFSQEVYFNTGKNYTKYMYKDSFNQSNPNLQTGSGDFYEIGLTKPFKIKNLHYSVALSLNEYNAIGSNSVNSYSWNTHYIGVHSGLLYSLFTKSDFNFLLKAGLNASTIIYGKQEIENVYYDLKSQKEFSGIILEPSIGFQVRYSVSSFGFLSVGYNFRKSMNITNSTNEKLSFNTNQLQFGIHFPIK